MSTTDRAVREVVTSAGTVRAVVSGDGPPLLYLHGVGDTGGPSALLARLAERHTVVRPDHPGFLGSDPLGCATVADVAARHVAVLDALGIDRCTVMGSSFGGWVAAELAVLAPERVAALVLVDPAGLRGPDPAPDLFALEPEQVVALSFHGPELKAAAADLTPRAGDVLRGNLMAAHRLAPTLADPTLAERLGALTSPALVVWGAEDEIFPASYAEQWRAAVPHARVEVVAGAGHLPHTERLEDFLTLLSRAQPSAGAASASSGRCSMTLSK